MRKNAQNSESETKNTNQNILYEEKVMRRHQGRCPEEKPSAVSKKNPRSGILACGRRTRSRPGRRRRACAARVRADPTRVTQRLDPGGPRFALARKVA